MSWGASTNGEPGPQGGLPYRAFVDGEYTKASV